MKAVRFHKHGGTDVLTYEDAPNPQKPGPGEVLVRVKAASVNHLDVWVRSGLLGIPIPFPHVPGSDAAGLVEEVGSGVTTVKAGDPVVVSPGLSCFKCTACLAGDDNLCDTYALLGVFKDGTYAECVTLPELNVLPKPAGISYEEASAYPLVFLTAWHMLITRARLKPGDDVLVLGAGSGVGSAAVQVGKLTGARVITTVGSEEKRAKAAEIGADHVVNHSTENVEAVVKKITDGRGVDVVFEHVGPATWPTSMKVLAKKGRIVTCGQTTGPTVSIELRFLFMRKLEILGSMMGTRTELVRITKLIAERKLKPVIDSIHPLKDAGKAQDLMEQRKFFGKLVLTSPT